MDTFATLKYDLLARMWVAVCDESWGYGNSPEQAVEALLHELNKHDLWGRLK